MGQPQICGAQHKMFQYFLLSLLSIIFILLIFKYINRSKTSSKLNLPPSPPRLPILGNLHQLGSLAHRSLLSLAQRHGPVMLLHFGQKPILIVSSAEAAKEVLQTQDAIFASRPKVETADRLIYSSKDLAFSPYGAYWREVRKIAVLQLLSASRVETFRAIREEEVGLTMDKIRQSCCAGPSVVCLTRLVASFTSNVVCRVALGTKFQGDDVGVKFWEIVSEFMYLTGVFNVGDFVPSLAWLNHLNGMNARIEKNKKDLDRIFESVIQDHVQRKKRSGGGGEDEGEGVEDFVDVLLRIEKDGSLSVPFDKDNIKALLLDMFVAGTDTSSSVTIWAMTELMRHPEIMKEVQTEVRETAKSKSCVTEDDLGQMLNLKLVIKETLRLHTPAPLLLPRELTRDTKLLGYDIAAKTVVFLNAWAIGRDPAWWEQPDEFRPQRFLNTSIDYKGFDFGALPFGGGRRGCPGLLFAAHKVELMLANLLYHFDWDFPSGETVDVVEAPGTVAFKKTPLRLITTPSRI